MLGGADQDRTTRPLPGNPQSARSFPGGLALLQILPGLADLLLQFRVELVGALVLGKLAEHDLQAFQFFLGRGGPAIRLFRLQVLRSQIGRHDQNPTKPGTSRERRPRPFPWS